MEDNILLAEIRPHGSVWDDLESMLMERDAEMMGKCGWGWKAVCKAEEGTFHAE